ncbi:hypothetical protein N2K95_10515 [Arthrobacter zhaoxinii]|uniref:SGNH hydrolase-type esterase domain-containing protein n=1 Tax=Arthrobacter zhaoxinii TaxID=2964616 RepID=A0ABY5YLZ9_9MICC|nr:hypothetical protein [Arthrobacter zhaoxinii]UWX96112.1 hypothetical protein N2K95_10515 [Arthrobacter zhaoxinii]
MAKRYIRLKEYTPRSDQWITPSPEYLSGTDGTLQVGPFRCRSDENGFIQTGNPSLPGTQPVVFLGDSFVESLYAPEHDRFVSVVERTLRSKGHNVQCMNGGYSGSTTLQLLNVLVNKVYPLVGPGGTVVLFAPHSDRDYLYKQGTYWSDTARGATILPPGEPGHPEIPRGQAAAVMVLRLLATAAQQLGIRLVLATAPYRTGEYDTDPLFPLRYHGRSDWFRVGMTRRRHWISTIEDTAAEFNLPMIRAEEFIGGDPTCFYDELHLNALGQARVAAYVSEKLGDLMTDDDRDHGAVGSDSAPIGSPQGA